jgi:hypothetical protein
MANNTNYTQRPAVIKWWPWWINAINVSWKGDWEHAIRTLQKGRTKFLDRRDRLGMVHRILSAVDSGEIKPPAVPGLGGL